MEIIKFDHLKTLQTWQEKRGLPSSEDLPSLGFTVIEGTFPIACGFLRMGEGFGMIDSVIANPTATLKQRSLAIDMLFERLLKACKNNGIKSILGMSVKSGMIKKSKKFGFKESDYKLMTLQLGE